MSTPAARRANRCVPHNASRTTLALPGAWADQALCAQADPDTWFPDEQDRKTAAAAIAICARCPVRAECLAHALAIGERHGIWGGLTARQRRALLARQEKAA